jgi:peptide/nickel transport system substrate-binding protein
MNKIAFGALAAAAVLVLGLPDASAQKAGGTLRAYPLDNPPSASIHEEATISTVQPFMSVFNNLVIFDQHATRNSIEAIRPELATQWRWNDDNTKLTFTLREGVRFHDGKTFTSADVKCTWDTIAEKRDAGWRKNPRKPWYFNLREVTADGPAQVTFHLERPQPSFISLLAAAMSPVYPCHVPGRDMRAKPIGTGPFKVVEFKSNELVRLARNTDYWRKDRPYLNGIEWRMIPAEGTRALAFQAGEIDLTGAGSVTIPLAREIKAATPAAHCEIAPPNTQLQLLMLRSTAPFDNDKLRRALMLAVDRKALSDILSGGQFIVAGALLPPPDGVWGLGPDELGGLPGYGDVTKNREEGRAVMRELGYGPDKRMRIKLLTRNTPTYRDPAVIVIDHLRDVYVDAELEAVDAAIWYARLARRDYQLAVNVSGIGVDDPDVVFYEGYTCGEQRNYTDFCSKEIDAKINEQSATVDPAARLRLVHEIDRRLQAEGARPVLYQSVGGTCWQQHVKGITIARNTLYNHWRLEDAWLDR